LKVGIDLKVKGPNRVRGKRFGKSCIFQGMERKKAVRSRRGISNQKGLTEGGKIVNTKEKGEGEGLTEDIHNDPEEKVSGKPAAVTKENPRGREGD